MQQQQPQATIQNQTPPSSSAGPTTAEAPPKQVALAMERLSDAGRLIADIRLGADRLLEALFVAAQPHQSTKPLHLFLNEDASMRQHLLDLRSVGTSSLSLPRFTVSRHWKSHNFFRVFVLIFVRKAARRVWGSERVSEIAKQFLGIAHALGMSRRRRCCVCLEAPARRPSRCVCS